MTSATDPTPNTIRVFRRCCTWFAVLGILFVLTLFASVGWANDSSLLDLLRQKQVLTPQEYDRIKGGQLTPAQRQELIKVLQEKGVLTDAEAARVHQAAPPSAAAAAVEKSSIPSQVGYDEGFFVRSADGNFNLRFNGRAVANLLFEEPDTSLTNNLSVDRARLSADATFYKYFRARVEGEFTASPILRDAFLALQPRPELNLQIGQFPVPFSYELIVSKLRTDFIERAAVVNQTMNPRRDIGLMAHGQLAGKILQYQLAVMNGSGQNRSDNNSDKDAVARLVVAPFVLTDLAHLKGFNLGGAFTYGHQPRETTKNASGATVLTNNSISGSTEPGFVFYQAIPRSGARLRTDAHVAWLDGPFSITTEYITTSEQRQGLGTNGADLPDLDSDGAYIGGTWLLTGETKPYNARIRPSRPLWVGSNPGLGAWEAALRYEYFKLRHDPDAPTAAAVANRYDAFLAGINWYPIELVRFSLNYVYSTYEEQGANLSPNKEKRSNNAVLGRAQVDF